MENQLSRSICVLGSANVDYFVYVNHIPVPGQTIQASKYMKANGGKGANQAVAIGKLLKTQKCTFIGQVGIDDEMKSLKEQMTQAGVILNWVQKNDVSTGKAFIYVDENSGQNSIVIVGAANMHYHQVKTLPQTFISSLNKGSYLLLQKQIPMEINVLAAKHVKSIKGKKVVVVMDCGGRDDPIPSQLLDSLDFISPNQTQLLRLDPTINVEDRGHMIKEIREKIISKHHNLKVLLKLGSKGSAIVTDKSFVQCPVAGKINPKVNQDYKIIDTVGAGDCFTGAFTVKYSELDWNDQSKFQQNYKKSMLFANCSAFLCITKKGAMPSMPSRKQVDQFMHKYGIN